MRTATLKGGGVKFATGLLTCVLTTMAHAGGVITNTDLASLRAAIAGGDTVYFATTGRVNVASTIIISNDVSLIDSNHAVMLSGSGASSRGPLFIVNSGVQFRASGLMFANGSATNGGAIYNEGIIVLANCFFSNNTAVGPGGALGASGSFGTVLGSSGGAGKQGAGGTGGAVYNIGTAIIAGCTFLTNQAIGGNGGIGGTGGSSAYMGGDGGAGGAGGSAAGGALYSRGVLQVSNTLFRFNSASGGSGGAGGTNGVAPNPGAHGDGGAGNSALGGALFASGGSIIGCTFHANRAAAGSSADAAADTPHFVGVAGRRGPDGYGGGIYAEGAVEIVNCTFCTNSVVAGKGGKGGNGNPYAGDGGAGGNAWGGSIYVAAGAALQVTNCTIVAGVALGGAAGLKGGILAQDGVPGKQRGANLANAGSLILKNTILAYPTNSPNVYGAVVDGLGNLSSDNTPLDFAGSRRNTDPLLLPLADNGGLTPTMSLEMVSPALNAGDCAGAPLLDQRGYARDGICDVGAVELQLSVTPALSILSSNNKLLLSWPASASHYSVLSASNLLDPIWTPVISSAKSDGGILRLTMPNLLTNGVQYFRLQAQ